MQTNETNITNYKLFINSIFVMVVKCSQHANVEDRFPEKLTIPATKFIR